MLGILGGEGKQENKNEVQEMENYGAEAGSAVKLLEELLNLGYRKNASDIHLEPQEDRMVVRMRLDGMLLHVREYDKEMHQPLVTRAKVLSGMDIAKKRVPQDGHFKEMIDGICLDVRTSVVPTIFGEKMVLRLLNMKTEIDHGKTFGMREKNYEKMKRILRSPADPVSYRTDRMRKDYHIIYDPGISRETAGEYRDHRGSCGAISSGDQPDAGE